jgi:tryptophan synthase alpha chain
LSEGRIEARFDALRREGRAGFIAYVMAGDPDLARSGELIGALPGAGADLIELGIIQKGALRALDAGATLADVLDLVRAFRAADGDTPVVLMGYLNPILAFGLGPFAAEAAAAGADGVIMVDCPPEEADALADALDAEGLALIRLATPTTDAARLAVISRRTRGFIYYVSVAGVTGVKAAQAESVAPQVARVRVATGLPVAVGFGIRTPAQARAIAEVADAAVVGSALVDAIEEALGRGDDPVSAALAIVRDLAGAVRAATREAALG